MVLHLLIATAVSQLSVSDDVLISRASNIMATVVGPEQSSALFAHCRVVRSQDGKFPILRVEYAGGAEVEFNPRTGDFVSLTEINGFKRSPASKINVEQAGEIAESLFRKVAPHFVGLGPKKIDVKADSGTSWFEVVAPITYRGVPFELPQLKAKIDQSDGGIRYFHIGYIPARPLEPAPRIEVDRMLNACAYEYFNSSESSSAEFSTNKSLVILTIPDRATQFRPGGSGFYPMDRNVRAAGIEFRGYYAVPVLVRDSQGLFQTLSILHMDPETMRPIRILNASNGNASGSRRLVFKWSDWTGRVSLVDRNRSTFATLKFTPIDANQFSSSPKRILVRKGNRFLKLDVDPARNIVGTGKPQAYRYARPSSALLK